MIFLKLRGVEQALARVAERVRQGGHHIPEPVVRRRYDAGWRHFEHVYKPLIDDWLLFDNAGDAPVLLDRSLPRAPS